MLDKGDDDSGHESVRSDRPGLTISLNESDRAGLSIFKKLAQLIRHNLNHKHQSVFVKV